MEKVFRIYNVAFYVALFSFMMIRVHYPQNYPPLDIYLPIFFILFIANPSIIKCKKIKISIIEHIIMVLSLLLPILYGISQSGVIELSRFLFLLFAPERMIFLT